MKLQTGTVFKIAGSQRNEFFAGIAGAVTVDGKPHTVTGISGM